MRRTASWWQDCTGKRCSDPLRLGPVNASPICFPLPTSTSSYIHSLFSSDSQPSLTAPHITRGGDAGMRMSHDALSSLKHTGVSFRAVSQFQGAPQPLRTQYQNVGCDNPSIEGRFRIKRKINVPPEPNLEISIAPDLVINGSVKVESKKNRRAYTIREKVTYVDKFRESGRSYKMIEEMGVHLSNLCEWEHEYPKMMEHIAMGLGEKRYVSRKMKQANRSPPEAESVWVMIEGQKYALDEAKRLWLTAQYYVREKGSSSALWARPGMNPNYVELKPYEEYEVSKAPRDWMDDATYKDNFSIISRCIGGSACLDLSNRKLINYIPMSNQSPSEKGERNNQINL